MHLDKDCIEMTKHISLAIALTVTTFLSAPAIAASLTPTLGENSAFSIPKVRKTTITSHYRKWMRKVT